MRQYLIFNVYKRIQGEPKNAPSRKLRYLRNGEIFVYQVLQDTCAKVFCFVVRYITLLTSKIEFGAVPVRQILTECSKIKRAYEVFCGK